VILKHKWPRPFLLNSDEYNLFYKNSLFHELLLLLLKLYLRTESISQNVLFHGAVHIKNIYIILLQLQITTKNHNTDWRKNRRKLGLSNNIFEINYRCGIYSRSIGYWYSTGRFLSLVAGVRLKACVFIGLAVHALIYILLIFKFDLYRGACGGGRFLYT
jgi:hypothetical protein